MFKSYIFIEILLNLMKSICKWIQRIYNCMRAKNPCSFIINLIRINYTCVNIKHKRVTFCTIVYYVSRRIMRIFTRRATILAGDRSQGVAEAKPRRSRDMISRVSILSESRNYPNCVHWHIFYFMWLQCVYEFLCVHSDLI